jgi:hypothetical protein
MLLGQHFDLDSGVLRGEPQTVTSPVMRAEVAFYRDLFSVSRSGLVVFRPGRAERRLVWVDRRGSVLSSAGPPGVIMNVTLSRDGAAAAFTLRQVETGIHSGWALDLARNIAAPLVENAWMPTYVPDRGSVLYRFEGGPVELRRKSLRDQREETVVPDHFASPFDVSADGRMVLYTRTRRNTDVGVAFLTGERKPQLLVATEHEERSPSLSPDARWFTYSSSQPGQHEIFVRRLPVTDEKWMISNGGGIQPLWSRDGREIFYLGLDGRLMTVPVTGSETFSAGAPQALFQTSLRLNNGARQYAASPDGQRFLMVVPTQDFDSELFRVLSDWRNTGASR